MKLPTRFPHRVKVGSTIVSIYRIQRGGRTVYAVGWSSAGRKYRLQVADLARALEDARLRAEQLSAGRIDASAATGDDFAALREARRVCGDVPLLAALREWRQARELCNGQLMPAARAWAEAHGTKLEDVTVAEAVERFLAACRRRGVNTKAGLERSLPSLVGAFGGQSIASVSSKALQKWLEVRYPNPASRNSHRSRFVQLWRWARDRGDLLPQTRKTEAERVETAAEPELEIGILTVRDFARVLVLLREKHAAYLPAAVLAGFCGLRRSEIHAQAWADLLLDRAVLRVSSAKKNTPSKRLVEIPDAARTWLLLSGERKGPVAPKWAMDRIRTFCREAAPPIVLPENAFRHSFISARVAATGDVAGTALQAGNSAEEIHAHYRELIHPDDACAWFALTPDRAAALAAGAEVVPLGAAAG